MSSPYRTDMRTITELTEDELAQACVDYVNTYGILNGSTVIEKKHVRFFLNNEAEPGNKLSAKITIET